MLTYAAHNVGQITFDGEQPLARGPLIYKFERALEQTVGAHHAVAVNSGTSALYLAVRACGLAGKRVAVPSITFCGTANAVIIAGATPVYADVGPDGNISLEWLKAHRNEWDVVIPVHYAGNMCDMKALREIAVTDPIVVDACHAIGAQNLMDYANAVCFSFHPAKQITTGEGGAVLTNDQAIDFRLRTLRHNGIASMYEASGIRQNVWAAASLNFWMSDLQASVGLEQLKQLAAFQKERDRLVGMYLLHLPDWAQSAVQSDLDGNCAWCMFPVLIAPEILAKIPRYGIMTEMLKRGIETQIHYHPLHLQPMGGGKLGDLPGAENFGARVLTLPLHNKMNTDDVLRVCAALKEIHG